MAKDKIVIVTRNMLGGGAERVIAQISNYFVEQGKTCKIITLNKDEVFYALDPKIDIMPVGMQSENKLVDKLKRYRAVRKMVLQEKPDLVLSFPEEIAVYVILAMLGTGIPVYASERNNPWVMPDVKATRILRTLMYPFAKGIIFQTKMAMSFFPASIQRKGIVLSNPVDAQRIPEQYCGEREKVIVAAGRLFRQKNFPLLLNAFAKFAQKHPDYRLRIFGEGEVRGELTDLADSLGIGDKVELPGRSSELLEKMNSGAMFVLSSDYEGMPNVLLEAMCMGMPVISTDCPSGGPRELIEDGVNGLLVPVGDVDSLCQAMEKLTDPGYAKQVADNAYQIRGKLTSMEVFDSWYRYLFDDLPREQDGGKKHLSKRLNRMKRLRRILKMKPGRVLKKICCFEEIYTIAYRNRDGYTLLDSELLSFSRIPYNDDFWYADPIMLSYRDNTYLFMESFDTRTQLGTIACAQFDDDGVLSEPQVIIQEDYHLSFPMVFSWNDGLYMIPETCANRSLNLYRCEGDIQQWTLVKSFSAEEELVDIVVTACHEDYVELICSALHEQDKFKNKWQKFKIFKDPTGYRLEADAAFNARKDYDNGYRMAGALVEEDSITILPTQESTEIDYGAYLYLNDFSGRDITNMPVLKKITPENILLADVAQRKKIGIHSYALSDKLEVVDIRYFRFSPRNRVRKIFKWLGK